MLLAPEPCSALTVRRSPCRRQVPWPDLFPSKDPSLLYELVKPVFQQIFLPLRSASVTGAAIAATEPISTLPHIAAAMNNVLGMDPSLRMSRQVLRSSEPSSYKSLSNENCDLAHTRNRGVLA